MLYFFRDARRGLAVLCLPLLGAIVGACSEGTWAEDKQSSQGAIEGSASPTFRIAAPGDCGGNVDATPVLAAAGEDEDPFAGEDDGFGGGGNGFHAADPLNTYAKECQADVGLMPEFDCLDFAEIPTTEDGVELTVAGTAPALTLQKNGKAYAGALDKRGDWNPRPKCDNPSWASTPCYPGTRVGLITSGDTSWAILCRRQKIQRSDDPTFDLIGVIAHNKSTGGTCFFDKANGAPVITKGKSFPQPGSADATVAAAATTTWAAPSDKFENCLNCHASGAFIRTPFVQSIRLSDAMDSEYKIVGATFTRLWGANAPKNLEVTGASCSDCHRISDTLQTRMFASIATGGADIDDKSSTKRLAANTTGATRWPAGYFMPPSGRKLANKAAWETKFGDERDKLHACLATPTGAECGATAFKFF